MEKAWKHQLVENGVLVEFCYLSRTYNYTYKLKGQASRHTNLYSCSETVLSLVWKGATAASKKKINEWEALFDSHSYQFWHSK